MRPPATGIVLAGGASRRFGRDKLAEPLGGRPLLAHALAAIATVVSEIVIVAAPGVAEPPVPAGLGVPVRVLRDRELHHGPLAGLGIGLAATSTARALVAGGDMPTLVPGVLAMLLARLDDRASGDPPAIVVLQDGDLWRPLPGALRVVLVRPAVDALLASGERRLRALLEAVPVAAVPAATWRRLDPAGATLRDVDRPDDLPA